MDAPHGTLAGRTAGRREWGTGSIVHVRSHDAYDVVLPLGTGPDGRRRRKAIRFRTREDAEAALPQLQSAFGVNPSIGRPIPAPIRRLTNEEVITRALQRGRLLRWTDAYLARVIVAWLAPGRVRLGVFGPCVYCGNELANTVDHIDPEGGDRSDNLASSCQKCNASKGKRTPGQWRAKSHDRFGNPREAA